MTVLGHKFRLMTEDDYMGLAGAEPGSWIAETDDEIFVLSPDGKEIAAIDVEGNEVIWKRQD